MWGKGNTPVLLMGAHPGAVTAEINVQVSPKSRHGCTAGSSYSILVLNHRTLTILCAHASMFNVALFVIARKWGQSRYPQLINRG